MVAFVEPRQTVLVVEEMRPAFVSELVRREAVAVALERRAAVAGVEEGARRVAVAVGEERRAAVAKVEETRRAAVAGVEAARPTTRREA